MAEKKSRLFEPTLVKDALRSSVWKLDPRLQVKNPVMFVVYLASLLTTALWVQALAGAGEAPAGFILSVSLWLWATLLFANFAEAMAESRGKAQAAALRGLRTTITATKLAEGKKDAFSIPVPAERLRTGDFVLVQAGELIPCDGEVIEGVASVDESAVTGESAPVIRE